MAAGVRAVPFFDPRPTYKALEPAMLADFSELLASGAFVNGAQVNQFEEAFARYCGVAHCVGVASGLDALRLALLAAGLEQDDEVVLPALTFAATLEAVLQAGGRPVLADIADADYCLDPRGAEAALTPRARILLPVHLYGQVSDLASLEHVAQGHGLEIIEDACQAHGAERDGRRAGSAGLLAAFSFYPTKNLGAFGDAGAATTSQEELAARMRALREHGQRTKYVHEWEGYTARLDTIQALVLLHKLPLLEQWNDERRNAAAAYTERLRGVGDLRLAPVPDGSLPVWHVYVVRTADADRLASHLSDCGIGTARHYPQPLHLAPAYERLGYREGDFPVAEALARECLSLPLFPGMAEAQLETVASAIEDYFRRG